MPYRAPSETEPAMPAAAPPREVVYPPNARNEHFAARRLYARYAITLVGGALACAFSPIAGAALGGLVVARDVYLAVRSRHGAARLRVQDGALIVQRVGAAERRIALGDVLGVELETRERHHASYVVRSDGVLGSGAPFAVDVSRVVLTLRDEEPLLLMDDFISNAEVVNVVGEIRRMLRAHGWVPESERESAGDV